MPERHRHRRALPFRLERARGITAELLGSSLLWGVIIAVLSWGAVVLVPQAGFDYSWHTGLVMAAHEHLQWGRQIMYTYGPLGFLEFPMLAYAGLLRWAYAYTLAVHLTLAVVLVWALRRTLGSLWLAVVPALLLISIPIDPVVTLVTIVAFAVLQSPPGARPGYALAASGGALSGLEFLIKFNTGTTVAAISIVTLLALPRRRWTLSVFVGVLAAVALLLWLLAHQGLDNLWAFVDTSLSVVSGYSQALGYEPGGEQWQYWVALLLFILGLVAAMRCGQLADHPRRLGLVLVWLILAYLEFKEGFVRHDGHVIGFFATLMVSFVGWRWRPDRRAVGALMWGIFVVAFFGVSGADPVALFHPRSSVQRFDANARAITSATMLGDEITAARRSLAARYGLDHQSYDLVRGQRVDVEPWEDSLAWAYDLRWSPTPEFQAFTGYTTLLDEANASTFARSGGPTRVLSQTPRSLDSRFPGFDAPAATRTRLCHFVPVHVTPAWEVLDRVADRCGPQRLLTTERALMGQPVAVPRPPRADDLVFVRIHGIQVAGFGLIEATLFRSRERYVTLNGVVHQLVPGTAGDGLLLTVPSHADDPGAYRLAPNPQTVSAGIVNVTAPSRHITFSFYAETIRPRALSR